MAHEKCAAKYYMLAGKPMNLSWKQQKRCVDGLLSVNGTKGDRLRETRLPSTGKRPVLPAAWRSIHAAINYAYAARHGYDIYFADVRGCARSPSWCAKLCAYSLLYDRWDEWAERPTYSWVRLSSMHAACVLRASSVRPACVQRASGVLPA